MHRTVPEWLPLALVCAAALWLRCVGLQHRPMHADEANQAVKAGQLLESGRYRFDPADHHGPTLYYAVLPVAWARGQRTLASLDETTLRLVPAVAGTLAVLFVGLLARPLGRWPAAAAAGFMALDPAALYYSRYFIQETLLVSFTLGTFLCARRWASSGRLTWAVAAGAGAGLMQATKASAPLFLAAALLAWLLCRAERGFPLLRRCAAHALAAAGAAAVVLVLFYTSFGSNPAGAADSLSTYGHVAARLQSGDTGHEKPWTYFLGLLTWQRRGGLLFEQAGLTALALLGCAGAVARAGRLLRWAALYGAVLLVVLSATPYKTPWHVVHLVPATAILAAGSLAWMGSSRRGAWAGVLVAAAVAGSLGFQAHRVVAVYAADPRNPYAYVHSSPDVLKFRPLADEALKRDPSGVIRVVSEEYWPLPWYFRGLDGVGYWSQPPDNCDGALVVASAGLAESVSLRLHGPYSKSYLGLRPGFVCVVFTPEK